jgi:tetratricopeptide (TPR) repeat protein
MVARSRILTFEALQRLKNAISKRFPYKHYPRIYVGSFGSDYNFAELQKQMEEYFNSNFSICPDTLRKILRREKADKKSLTGLFQFFGEALQEDEMIVPIDKLLTSESSQYCQRNNLRQLPYYNLPQIPHIQFIGRSADLEQLLQLLRSDYPRSIIRIDGLDGSGKTALVLEAAYLCLEAKHGQRRINAPIFDAIIFVSAKEKSFSTGDADYFLRKYTLNEIIRTIASTLEDPSINRANEHNQFIRIYKSLQKQRTLLIVDDLHNMIVEEQKKIISFLSELPPTTKVVITTRRQESLSHIRLGCLSEEESYQLIRQQLQEKKITLADEDINRLYQSFSGIPIAFIYSIGKLASGYPMDSIICDECQIRNDVSSFCFENSIQSIRGTPAHNLLASISLFPNAADKDAAIMVAGLSQEPKHKVSDYFVELSNLSLISEQEGRYVMLPITRNYTLREFPQYPEFERDARSRLFDWYLNFVKKNGGIDWGDWCIQYDFIDREWGNISSVLLGCAANGQYEDVKRLWWYLNHFTDLYGYWQERLYWLDWLLSKSRDFSDIETLVYALTRKIWTLTMMGNYDGAEQLLSEAWEFCSHTDIILQDYLAHNTTVLYIRQKRYQDASEVLDKKEKLVAHMDGVEERIVTRCQINTMRNRAKIFLRERKFDAARIIYEQVLETTNEIGWNRLYCYAHNILANIAIEQGDWKKAQEHLDAGLPIAKLNRNNRRLAFYKFSLARLERCLGNVDLARKLADESIDEFSRLGMTREVEEISALFGTLD